MLTGLRIAQRSRLSFLLPLGLIAAVALWPAFAGGGTGPARAAGFTANSTVDGVDASPGDGLCDDGAGNCTLRAAIQETNALPGADTITLPAATYTLSIPGTVEDAAATGDLDIAGDLTITGAGAASTIIDGGGLDRVFDISGELSGSATVDIHGVTIQNGRGNGGGIRLLYSTLILNNSTVRNNAGAAELSSGGGIFVGFSTVTLINSTVSGNTAGQRGGGIEAHPGNLTLINTSVRGNTSGGSGGGISFVFTSGSTLTLTNSTVSGNVAGGDGGGIYLAGGNTMILTNSTISGNTADGNGGGMFNDFGSATLTNVTVNDNGAAAAGGIFNGADGTVTLQNTIVGNSVASGNCSGTITSNGHNLESGNTCALTASGDLVNTDPNLGPLADNGGLTQTHALLPGSPAIDAGDNASCAATDQRGAPRPAGAGCDSGAYEAEPVVPTPTPSPGATERVSVDSAGNQGNSDSRGGFISADGRYVAFESEASNLVPGDTNGAYDVFVHDRQTEATERVSVDSAGNQVNAMIVTFVISADGRYVAFDSDASDLVPGDTNGVTDVFVHDRETGVTERVSVDSAGNQGDGVGMSFSPAISADGRFVAFSSFASNLVPGDTNGRPDVFVHDRQTGATERVNEGGLHTSISADGRYVAFDSSGGVFVHDRQTGATQRVSVDSAGNPGNGGKGTDVFPAISADGRYVAFMSIASNLVTGDTNGAYDIFVHDRQTGTTERVNVDSAGNPGNHGVAGVGIPAMSADGRYVAFSSTASNLVSGDTNGVTDGFVHDRQTGATERVSVDSTGDQGNNASSGGSISADGRYVAFSSTASNLVPGDTNDARDVFVHDRSAASPTPTPTATTTLTEGAPAGATQLLVAGSQGFGVRDLVTINPGGPNEETNVIAGFGSIHLAAPLLLAHALGELIVTDGRSAAPGDANCDGQVNAVDALFVLRRVAGLLPLSSCWAAGNVRCLDDVDATDALFILRTVAALAVNLPPGCPAIAGP